MLYHTDVNHYLEFAGWWGKRSKEERLPTLNWWVQQHDAEVAPENQKDNYFVAPHFYCMETICAPCGVVIAWILFDMSKSPTKILAWSKDVYPVPDLHPNYICIDKGCQILHTAISNGFWNIQKQTSYFIIDSYHYIHHWTSNYLCCKWCNPAPLNGFAPNLVIVSDDANDNPHYKHAFNTQVCPLLKFTYANIHLLFS
jgi:hypothetical protein